MSTKIASTNFIRHISAQWLATFYVASTSFILSILLARKMGPESYGEYANAVSISCVLAILQGGGFATLIMREQILPTQALAKLTYRLPGLALGHLLVTTIVLAFAAALLPPPFHAKTIAISIICFGAITYYQQKSAHLKSTGEFEKEARWQMYTKTLIALSVSSLALMTTPTPNTVFMAWGASTLLAVWLFSSKADRTLPIFRLEPDAYRATIGFLWIELATNIYHRIDIAILHRILDNSAEVGYYAVAYSLFDGIILLITPAALIYFRELRVSWSDKDGKQELSRKTLTIAFGIGALLTAVCYMLIPTIVAICFGETYFVGTSSAIRWLSLSFIFVVPNSVLTQFAIAANRERWYAFCASACALLNITVNIVLIPRYGIYGAALATLATEAGLGCLLAAGLLRYNLIAALRK